MFKKFILATTVLMALNGCTAIMWSQEGWLAGSKGMVTHGSKTVVQPAGTDQIRAFARTRPDSKNLPANRLLMMGDNYWYLLHEDTTKFLAPILNSSLSQQFTITQTHPQTGNTLNQIAKLHVQLKTPHEHFQIDDLCLNYAINPTLSPAQQQQERDTLQQLSFKNMGKQYQFCIGRVTGHIYQPVQLPADYRFERSIPVQLYIAQDKETTHIDGKIVARNIALTPFTLIGDIILLPVWIAISIE